MQMAVAQHIDVVAENGPEEQVATMQQAPGVQGKTLSALFGHWMEPRRVRALKVVIDALHQRERILRKQLSYATTPGDRKKLHSELAILRHQLEKGRSRLRFLSSGRY